MNIKIFKCAKKSNKTEKEYTTFYHMKVLGNKISNAMAALEHIVETTDYNETAPSIDRAIHLTFVSVLIVDIESFMDEWNKYLKHQTHPNKRIKDFKKCVKPVTKLITNDFRHLRSMRNQLFAHPYRDNDGNSVFLNANYGLKEVPKNIVHVAQLVRAVQFLHIAVQDIYRDESDEISRTILKISHDSSRVKNAKVETDELNEKLTRARNEATANLNRYFKNRQ